MVFVNGQLVPIGDSLQQTFDNVMALLREQQWVIVDEEGQPMSQEKVMHHLENKDANLQAIAVSELESETVQTTLEFLEDAILQLQGLIQTEEVSVLYRSFSDLMESLLHLAHLGEYFNIDDIKEEQVELLANRVLTQIESNNDSYLREVLEYECIPMLENFKKSLEERKPVQ
ncbi:hypothetical protein [Paenibacillus alkalitolerans]|uniref:hypothetical protein n=1 Tax=Paenibacillus alkalitolerans TaxID=2799335 RepID=UPI0018F44F18|nr:hypothetical protein [Paenibacillus alkalitolerans]